MENKKFEEEKIRNFYYLLAYAFEEDRIDFLNKDNFGSEHFENIFDLFSIILCSRMNQIIKEGLYGEYIFLNDDLEYIKGKINVYDTIKRDTIRKNNRIVCTYDEYSINNLLNQIIKTTIYNLMKKDILNSNKTRLRKLFFKLDNIDILNNIKIIQWDKIQFNKLNNHYIVIIRICEFILNGLIMNKDSNNYDLQTIDDNQQLHHLFEKFIRNYLLKYYNNYRKTKIQNIIVKSEKMNWIINDNKKNINVQLIPSMHTDITIKYHNKIKIIDTKFYSKIFNKKGMNGFEKDTINSSNWYQINSYVINKKYSLQKNNQFSYVSGMLLYAQTIDEIIQDKEIDAWIMDNRMQLKIIDFNKEFGNPYHIEKDTIVYQLKELAESIINELK